MSATPSRARLDRLGTLLSVAAAAALVLLPFVVCKANRIVPGDPRGFFAALPGSWRAPARWHWRAPPRSR
jgi:hypothetical protein